MRLRRFGERVGPGRRLAWLPAPGRDEVAPGVLGHRLEPGAKAAARVVLELAKGREELDEHLLGDVVGVGVLQAPGQAPAANPWLVLLEEEPPGLRVVGIALKPLEQRSATCRYRVQPASAHPRTTGRHRIDRGPEIMDLGIEMRQTAKKRELAAGDSNYHVGWRANRVISTRSVDQEHGASHGSSMDLNR